MNEFGPDILLQRSADLVAAEMDGEWVMMSVEQGRYYGVGGVGFHVWERLQLPVSFEELVQGVCAEFDVEPQRCREDLAAFLRAMLANGLVHRR